jgi:hypothetical protein
MKNSFTLIETLVTILIFTLAMGAVSALLVMGYRTHSYTFQQATAINEARKGVEAMVKEIREARIGDDGGYIIEKAEDYEFIFYSDIDKDKEIERVRYFIKPAGGGTGSQTDQCVSFSTGGSCSVSFSNFLTEALDSAQVKVSLEGDLNSSSERVDIYADGLKIGTLCTGSDCGQCSGSWQDLTTFDITSQAADNDIQFTADASNQVDPFCDWQEVNHSIKAKFEFSWQETASPGAKAIFKKGVINPTSWPIKYPSEDEEIFIVSENIQNEVRGEPVFTYYDGDYNPLSPADRLEKTTLMHLKLIININPDRSPEDFILQSDTQIRNLKINL